MTNYEHIQARYDELMIEKKNKRVDVLKALAQEFGPTIISNWLIWLSTQR